MNCMTHNHMCVYNIYISISTYCDAEFYTITGIQVSFFRKYKLSLCLELNDLCLLLKMHNYNINLYFYYEINYIRIL